MKNKIITIIFIIYIFAFSILGIVFKDEIISKSERRKLKTFPEFTFTSEYITNLDKYFLDHFPYRDNFRSLKANLNYKVFRKLDNNDIYLKDNYIFKSNYPTNKDSINYFIDKTNKVKENFSEDNNVYMLIIPDKNYYLNDKDFLQLDYDYIYSEINKLNINNIDIRNIMNLNDYYETDTHWKQENLDKVIKEITNKMNLNYESINYKKNVFNKFYGVYYGESAINRDPEKLTYLTNDVIDNANVYYLENDSLNKVYNEDKLNGLDSYDVYLDGASAYIEIINENVSSDRELIIFRDSFGSSLTPLLINYYKKITIIDNRYINSDNYLNYVNFTNQDILFLYSTLIVNNSYTLKG